MKKILSIALIVSIILSCITTNAYAWGARERIIVSGVGGLVVGFLAGSYIKPHPKHYDVIYIGGYPFLYSDGFYYQMDPYGRIYPVQPPTFYQQVIYVPVEAIQRRTYAY